MKTLPLHSGFRQSLAVLMILPPLVFSSGCSPTNAEEKNNQSSSSDQPYYHQAQSVQLNQLNSYSVERRFVGKVQVKQNAALGFEQAGKISELMFDEGDFVQQGDLLASQDTELLKVERKELEAQLSETEAQLNLTRANLKRLRQLKQNGFTSTQSLDELQSQQKVLLASRLRVRAALDANQIRINKARLYAPFSARISQRMQDSGTVVNAGTPVFQLLQEGNNEVRIGIPVRLADSLVDQDHTSDLKPALEIHGKRFPAQLLALGADVNPATRTVSARFQLPAYISAVNGQLAYLTLNESFKAEGYWVPMSALTDGIRGMWNVYALSPAESEYTNPEQAVYTLQSRNIQVLHATEDKAYISGAIQDGEQILSAGLHRLVPGQSVRINPEQTLSMQHPGLSGDVPEANLALQEEN
ncbi:efflux RND transporter periplasmic adaptor subunit [Oceanospirillum sediminis]|uniref:Efflux RND transporter periplasmic adaptor subunit n=1 Tax=Oceanospirillum sediminis TaxID=2760088 RepID=A0A839IXB4_9GAMM|nr:efflux RND transporter periplasmic adaptor subunit [Oceanospirillum sediminis]MBB1489611.1 efflux RND transporter periplasmic adaptor subunit [Oceanospirillum sediminis]